jgi:hypothetical protein
VTGVIFTADNSWVSKAIRFITRGKTSHAALTSSIGGVPVLIHASIGGVQVTPRRKWLRSNRAVAEFVPASGEGFDLGLAARALGERYDYVSLLGFIPVLIARRIGARIRNPFARSNATVCSEFVVRAAAGQGRLQALIGLDPERTTPQDLLRACEQESGLFRVE